jgi:tetratricopeptide (TPR) repeat protein
MDQLVGPLNRVTPVVFRGDSVRLDVVVRTKGIGHFFPGGTADAFDVWIEVKAVDDKGKVIFWSGHVPTLESGKKGPVDPGAHYYKSVLLDGHGNHINKRNVWAARNIVYSRSIPPGAADLAHYRLDIPEDAGERIMLTAKVNHRKFSWWNTQFAYAGIRDPEELDPDFAASYDDGKWVFSGDTSNVSGALKEIPDLPIVTMAAAKAELLVSDRDPNRVEQKVQFLPEDGQRWSNYGIGLHLQRDYSAAEQVFREVTRMLPDHSEGWINLGRSLLVQGRPAEAHDSFLKVLDLKADPGKTHFFLGISAQDQGHLDQALSHLREAESIYPRDRRILFQLGKTLKLQQQYQDAVEVFKRALSIDPESYQVHYQLSLCYKALGDEEQASLANKLHERFRPRIAAPFGRAAPEHDNERRPIHEHTTVPLDQITSG